MAQFLFFRILLPQISPHAVDMPLKIAVLDQLGENVLHKGRHGAGIKAELLFINLDQMHGQNHISDTKRRRNRLGKGVEVNHQSLFSPLSPRWRKKEDIFVALRLGKGRFS